MTFTHLAVAGTVFYRRTQAAVVLGVAAAVAVLAGSLLVGASVRGSLKELATSRLGKTDAVVIAETPFTGELGARLTAGLTAGPSSHAALLAMTGVVTHQPSGRRATSVLIYGVDAEFFTFHGVSASAPEDSAALLSPDLATELGAAADDDLLVRVGRPTDIPIDSLHGRRDDVGRSIRLSARGALSSQAMGEFSLAPAQGPVRSVFVPLERLQRDLGLAGRVNTLLVSGPADVASQVRAALARSVTATDLGIKAETLADGSIVVESSSGLIPDAVARTIEAVARREALSSTSVLTWLANRMTVGTKTVPYSIVTAVGPDAAGDPSIAKLLERAPSARSPIVLTEWAARDLAARAGDSLELEYYRWADEGRLVTDRASFVVAGVVPMRGLAVDRRMAPDYPGITSSNSFADWDPPFPINLKLVRPLDEEFWKKYRTAPKAFLPLAAGQELWRTRHGQLTSMRLRTSPSAPPRDARTLAGTIAQGVDPLGAGFNVVDVRAQNLAASAGATDFGAYFSYFSVFLMVSALLLTTLFFRLGIEQRLSQVGVLRATGFSVSAVRKLFLTEGLLVSAAGALLGIVLAIGWAALMMYGLRTWWNGAVGTTRLVLHIDWLSLLAGAAAAAVVAIVAITFTVRRLGRLSPRSLLAGGRIETAGGAERAGAWLAVVALTGALALSIAAAAGLMPAAGGFFGAGTLVLAGGLAAVRAWLRRRRVSFYTKRKTTPDVFPLALANAAWRPGRSLTATGLVAAAVFLLVSVDSFRKRADADAGPASGTGGFALVAESALPIVHDLSTPDGRREAGLDSAADGPLAGVDIVSLRLRPGDDASCLNLYQPKRPRVLAVPPRLVEAGRFRFARTIATSDAERQNPWVLLERASVEEIPAIVDQTSLQYVLHASVGDVITIDADTARPVRLHIVASLDDSMLQGEILISEAAFERLFALSGYRVFLVSVTPPSAERVDGAARALESALGSSGFDAQPSSRRLETYHRVENTYLSTFQALGGLGLMLGVLGLVAVIARNVLERRRELALLGAAGFTGRDLQRLVVSEHLALVLLGLVIGVAAAITAIAPVLAARGAGLPAHALLWLLPVTVAGVVAAVLATRSVRRLPLVASLRSE
jgi:putative ABC transport system permease protein